MAGSDRCSPQTERGREDAPSPGSDLYVRYVLPDESHDAINQRVWAGTPWIVSAYTDDDEGRGRRRHDMVIWCRDRFGTEAWPFSDQPRPGRWREGNATVFGWTWFGFSTLEEMAEFSAAWPPPDGGEAVHSETERDKSRDEHPSRRRRRSEP